MCLLAAAEGRGEVGGVITSKGYQTGHHSLSPTTGYFEGYLQTFLAFFWQPKQAIFLWEVGPPASASVITKTGILSQTVNST